VSLWGSPCVHGVLNTPYGEVLNKNDGQINGVMFIGMMIFGRIWKLDFDQPYLLIGGES
jgi:hypothetical protein